MLQRLLRAFRRPAAKPTGTRGEDIAAAWLKRQGYTIAKRNFTVGDDEADLVAIDPDQRTIVIVEVKTRGDDFTAPEASVTRTKQFHLSRLASRMQRMAEYRDRPFRFDVIAVVMPECAEPIVRHIPGAFQSPW